MGENTTAATSDALGKDENPTSTSGDESLTEMFYRGISLLESSSSSSSSTTSSQDALLLFQKVHKAVHNLSLFSSNETIEDITTKSIPFLATEHFMAMALVSLPTTPGKIMERKAHVHQSLDLWSSFIGKLESLELLTTNEIQEYHELIINDNDNLDNNATMTMAMTMPRSMDRDTKIAKFKAKQQAVKEVERLRAIRERRNRMGFDAEDEIDGYNDESLERSVALNQLSIYKMEAFDNWLQSKRELPMIEMMVKMEEERSSMARHHDHHHDHGHGHQHAHHSTNGSSSESHDQRVQQRPPPTSNQPLKVTHITKDANGQLQIKRDEIRSKVFRPGWNQPTMSLEELGEREYLQAMEREERQRIAEAEHMKDPRRYEELVRDGLEDDTNLVDASAKLDRDWDDWKDENPRGSGNKMANRGDKNF